MKKRFSAFFLAALMVAALLPAVSFAAETEVLPSENLQAKVTAATNGDTIKLTENMTGSFDLPEGKSLTLDLNGKTLTLKPAVGSAGTVSQGIRVLRDATLTIKNGTILSGETVSDNIKVSIANYGTLTLDDVELKAGPITWVGVNNRGALTLTGNTTIETAKEGWKWAITNDPYDYVTQDTNASLTIADSTVKVGVVAVETGKDNGNNTNGKVVLNISAGVVEELKIEAAVGAENNNAPDVTGLTGGQIKVLDEAITLPSGSNVMVGTPAYAGPVMNWVKVNAADNGVVKSGPLAASAGATVTLYPKAAEGYVLDIVEVLDAEGNTVELDGLKFAIPAGGVTVNATFKLAE